MNRDVLILYSQQDSVWKVQVEKYIGVLVKSGHDFKMDFWDESRTTHAQWYTQFQAAQNRAGVILLLLSESFLNSGLMQSDKVVNRLKKKQEGGFPLFILHLSEGQDQEIKWLKAIPTLPEDGKLLSDLNEADRENTLLQLTEHIIQALKFHTTLTEGILSYLAVNLIGPMKELHFEPGRRLNMITGDNAMGKTLLLESVWWVLSGVWSTQLLYPRKEAGRVNNASIQFQLMATSGNKSNVESISFNWDKQEWPRTEKSPFASALVVYAGINGSFSIWDPVYAQIPPPVGAKMHSSPLVIDKHQINDGVVEDIPGKGYRYLCNGLIRDLVSWQRDPNSPVAVFLEILKELSWDPKVLLTLGEPVRISRDAREFPSLRYPYGDIPFIHTAASVQRILSLAYILVWVWKEHKIACQETRNAYYKNLVVLIDEVECHLHPQWQRDIIPSLLKISTYLDKELNIQFLITTHSPLVLASLEPVFQEENDALFHLKNSENDAVEIDEQPFQRHGRVDNWFTSDTFGLMQARSLEAEAAIQHATELQLADHPAQEDIQKVHQELLGVLGDCDTFWPRWTFFAEQRGVRT